MTYREFLHLLWTVVSATDCHFCGGAKKIGADNRTCPVCKGSGSCPGGR